jgi:hypothetical protein
MGKGWQNKNTWQDNGSQQWEKQRFLDVHG